MVPGWRGRGDLAWHGLRASTSRVAGPAAARSRAAGGGYSRAGRGQVESSHFHPPTLTTESPSTSPPHAPRQPWPTHRNQTQTPTPHTPISPTATSFTRCWQSSCRGACWIKRMSMPRMAWRRRGWWSRWVGLYVPSNHAESVCDGPVVGYIGFTKGYCRLIRMFIRLFSCFPRRAWYPQLDHYLPLPPLLDPYLGEIIPPLMTKLSTHFLHLWTHETRPRTDDGHNVYSNGERIARVGRLVNWVVKVRGRKNAGTPPVRLVIFSSHHSSLIHP